MAAESIKFEGPRAPSGGHGNLTEVVITPAIAAVERVIDLKLSTGHSFRLTAKAAHLVAVALYGASEDHAEALPPTPELRPGDLVTVYYLRGSERRIHTGYYENGLWRVSGTKDKAPDGYIYVMQDSRSKRLIQRDLVEFHSRPEKKKA